MLTAPSKSLGSVAPVMLHIFLCNRRKEESRSGLKYVGRNAVTHLIPKSLMTQTCCAQSARSNRCLSNLGLQKRAWPTVQPPPAKTTLCSRTGSIQSVQQREVPHILFKPILWKIVEFGSSNHGNISVCVPIVKSVRQDIMSGFMLFPQMSVPWDVFRRKIKRWACWPSVWPAANARRKLSKTIFLKASLPINNSRPDNEAIGNLGHLVT